MAESTISIINLALLKLGERPIMSLEDESVQGKTAKEVHAQAFRYVLSKHPWTAAVEYARLLPDAQWSSEDSVRYPFRYRIPNKLVKVLCIYDSNEHQSYNWKRRGNYIFTEEPRIYVEYVKDITNNAAIDSTLAEVLTCYLAYVMAPRLTKEEANAQRLYQEYRRALIEAVTSDSLQKAPLFYGPNTPEMGDPYEDHPNGWADR